MAQPIRVVIADAQPMQRGGYRMVLDSQPDISVVGEVGDGAHALNFVRRSPTDVVLMDIRMPRVNGFAATERILADERVAALGPVPRIVLVTALDLEAHVPVASELGAFAMLYKDAPPEVLLAAIRGAAASDSALPDDDER